MKSSEILPILFFGMFCALTYMASCVFLNFRIDAARKRGSDVNQYVSPLSGRPGNTARFLKFLFAANTRDPVVGLPVVLCRVFYVLGMVCFVILLVRITLHI
jgi:hypothetical protein